MIPEIKKAREYIIKNKELCFHCLKPIYEENKECEYHEGAFEEMILKVMYKNYCEKNGLKMNNGKSLQMFMKKNTFIGGKYE